MPIISDTNPKNWTEDFPHENGCYVCKCIHCGDTFMGHKRRVVCKVCHAEYLKTLAHDTEVHDRKWSTGWTCPRCGRGNAPTTPTCPCVTYPMIPTTLPFHPQPNYVGTPFPSYVVTCNSPEKS